MATVIHKKTTFVVLLLHCYLSLATLTYMFAYAGGNPNMLCRKGERDALLTFKQGIDDPFNSLSSWIGQECCTWKGIGCHNITGHVVHLNLRNLMLDGLIIDSLRELKHLHYLDLSLNGFSNDHFPSFFGYLQNLRYLNLSYTDFKGKIPHQLANLSNLHSLDIQGNYNMQVDNLEWLSHLSLLEFLDMSSVNLSKASNWLQVMNMLPSLSELHLSSCELDKYDPIPYVNFSSLTVLDLSYNYFVNSTFDWINSLTSFVTLDLKSTEIKVPLLGVATFRNLSSLKNLHLSGNNLSGTIPKWLYNMTTLERLDLSYNNIQGVLPKAIGCVSQLMLLDLSHNDLEGKIPRFLGNLCNLQHLDLSENKLGGGLYDLLGNSSSCTTKNLEFLDLSGNRLLGTLPDHLGKHKNLCVLSLGKNMLSGPIPVSLGKLSSLRKLLVNDNQLNGTIPVSLGYLSNLEVLDISSNFLEGFVSEEHFSNLTKLRNLHASWNSLTLQVSTKWVPPFQLQTLRLASWALGPKFPTWLQSQEDLRALDFSDASISDVIPSWFWSLCSQIDLLDLSQNQLRGNISSLYCGDYIYLGSNNFSGPLPNVSSGIVCLDLSNNSFHGSLSPLICEQNSILDGFSLEGLDLSKNLLSGELPDCWMDYSELIVLNLGSNKLTGNIPSSIGSLSRLQVVLLDKNNLSGGLPLSLQNCKELGFVDFSENHLSGSLSNWLGNSSVDLIALMLRSNRFNGSIPQEICHFNSLQIMDLASNKLSGPIPRCFGNLRTCLVLSVMVKQYLPGYSIRGGCKNSASLRVEGNDYEYEIQFCIQAFLVTKGNEYEYKETLSLVVSMDLSSNNLIGEIPEEVINLHGIRFLNLSNNKLHGKISENISAMKILESLDVSMNQLTGVIPQSMATLTFLSYLNLSHNNFSGRIPSSTQLQSFSALSFIGNRDLCGLPLTPSCSGDDTPLEPIPNADDDQGGEDGGWIDMKWFYLSMPFGFVMGFWGVVGPLAFNKAWRYAFFMYLDDIKYKLFGGV